MCQKQPFSSEAMMQLRRISEPQVSPDGQQLTFTAGAVDVEKNTVDRQIYLVPMNGGTPRALTSEGKNLHARWSPDGKQIAFLSTRGGKQQIWLMSPDGSNQHALTTLATEADGPIWSPDGKRLVFTSEVYPDCQNAECNAKRLEADEKNKVKAHVATTLLYRHWTDWRGARRKHLFTVALEGGEPKDLTPGLAFDVPPFSLDGGDDYSVSPDGKEVAYTTNTDADQAYSTNSEIWIVPMEGGEARKISNSPGADTAPQYSPDGTMIAWRMQVRAGYESDRWRLVIYHRDSGKIDTLTENIDRHVTGFTWHPDSKRIAFTLGDRGRQNAMLINVAGGGSRSLTQGAATVDELQFTADGKTLVYSSQSGSNPAEIFKAVSSGGVPVALTHLNDSILERYDLKPLEDFVVNGGENTPVHCFLVKPFNFDPNKKYPALMLIHGGPQGAWGESFSYRWNPQVFAAAGFVVVMPNPRGSTGYGTKFTDEINGDWGGKVYEDVMAATDYTAKLPYVDGNRMAAAGGSYGGYMVDWILGHSDRFKALVSHAGVYDLRSMAGATEELWFPSWEFKGMPWQSPDIYEKWSPSNFVPQFKTPTLVIHGELDYRVPYTQGLQLYTGLQSQKVPSKLVVFPDEGHWILKPQNSLFWYKQFISWVQEWTAERQ